MTTIERTEIRQLRDGGWIRYVHYADRDIFPNRIFLASRDDDSPAHNGMSRTMGGDYDGNCAACWLGHGHSIARHTQNLANFGR